MSGLMTRVLLHSALAVHAIFVADAKLDPVGREIGNVQSTVPRANPYTLCEKERCPRT